MASLKTLLGGISMLYKVLLNKKFILGVVITTNIILIYLHFGKNLNFTLKYLHGIGTDHQKRDFWMAASLKHGGSDLDMEIGDIFNRIEQMIPRATLIDKNHTTSAERSQATVIKPKDKYCIGDNLTVQLDMYDYLGNRKTYGGDFFIARIYSPELQAGASGKIEDFNNGTYYVHFTLFWEGKVQVSIRLHHPSEAVSALWKARNAGYDNIDFIGTFMDGNRGVQTKCNFEIHTTQNLCEYIDERDGEYFCCVKPENVSCDAFHSMMTVDTKHSYLNDLENILIGRSNTAKEMKKPFESIEVRQCNRSGKLNEEKCRTGMHSPLLSGFFLKNVWNPVFCSMASDKMGDLMARCLPGKLVFLMGDSTLRQWLQYFTNNIKTFRFFELHEGYGFATSRAVDIDKNIQLQWTRHGHPFLIPSVYNVRSLAYVPREIDKVIGGSHTIVVITIGHHFRPFPLTMFLRRLIGVRKAVSRLLVRSPDTNVIIKTANVREFSSDAERYSDFHGYIHYLATRQVFQGLDVGFVDTWDMAIALASHNLHPTHDVVANQIQMFLTYIC